MSQQNTGGRPMVVDDIEVSRHYVSFVEGELRLYPARKRRLAYLETCIATATPAFEEGMPRAPGVGNPTLSRAVALMQDQERTFLQAWVRMVEDTFHALSLEQQQVIRLMYFENRLRPEGVADELKIHFTNVYKHRNRALLAFCVTIVGEHAIAKKSLRNRGA